MVRIRIPQGTNKIDYVYVILHKLIVSLKEYNFINCTQSPLEELDYVKINNFYYRYVNTKEIKQSIDISKYINAYLLDVLNNKKYSLDQYIEDCLLFELEDIKIVLKINNNALLDDIKQGRVFAELLICPDGLNEVQIIGEDNNVQVITEILAMLKSDIAL